MNWSLSYFLQWNFLLPNFLACFLMPLITFSFFRRWLNLSFSFPRGILYMVLSTLLSATAKWFHWNNAFILLAEIFLLTMAGLSNLRQRWKTAFALAALILSVVHLCAGILQWLSFAVFAYFSHAPVLLIQLSDTLRELLAILLFLFFSGLITTHFQNTLETVSQMTSILLAIPVFFISLVEQTVRSTIYGDTLVADEQFRILFPVVNHAEILILQLLAAVCLLLTLTAFQQIHGAYQAQQTIFQLRQLAKEQETYIQEARLRHKQTQAFRHDTKNHLLILAQLLKKGQSQEAYHYLIHLEETLEQLSSPVQTGNAAADALLGSKLSIARQNHIQTSCQLVIPAQSRICDTDWCIVLANALDNAVTACLQVPESSRYIQISGRKKGNFYLLSIENSCDASVSALPEEGIGLSNIRAVVEKNHGTFYNNLSAGVYRLELLFILS